MTRTVTQQIVSNIRPYEPLISGFKFKDNSISYTPNVYIHGDDSDDNYYDY